MRTQCLWPIDFQGGRARFGQCPSGFVTRQGSAGLWSAGRTRIQPAVFQGVHSEEVSSGIRSLAARCFVVSLSSSRNVAVSWESYRKKNTRPRKGSLHRALNGGRHNIGSDLLPGSGHCSVMFDTDQNNRPVTWVSWAVLGRWSGRGALRPSPLVQVATLVASARVPFRVHIIIRCLL